MSKGAAVGFGAMGVAYLIALPLAELLLFAFVAFTIAVVVTVGLAAVMLFAWFKCLRTAAVERDYGWLRDLLLAPAAGVTAALVLGYPVALAMNKFETSERTAQLNEWLSEFPGVLLAIVLGPAMFFLFVGLLFYTPVLLTKRDEKRLLAYPAIIFYSLYLTGLGISFNNGWDSDSGPYTTAEVSSAVSVPELQEGVYEVGAGVVLTSITPGSSARL